MKILIPIIAFASFGGFTGNVFLYQSCGKASVNSDNTKQSTEAPVVSPTPQPPSIDIRKWITPTFLGLKVGESNEEDVQRLFGKPDDEYPNRDDDKVYEKNAEDEVVQDYRNLKEANGHVVVILGKKSRIVKVISLYPSDQISLDEAISKYGQGFFQIESWESICIKEGRRSGTVDRNSSIPIVLIYPNLGLLVDIRKNGELFYVGRLDYLMKCI